MPEATSYDELRSAVLEYIRRYGNSPDAPMQIQSMLDSVAVIARERGLKHDTGVRLIDAWQDNRFGGAALNEIIQGRAVDVVWDLIIEGVLRLGDAKGGSQSG